jgi:hypothetical protein
MSTYINNNVKFHGFSKSPVSPDTTLGGAVNPSGHTITTSQVHSQDIPAFLNTFQNTKEEALTWLGKNYATPAHNDIVYYGGEFKAGFSTPKCLKYNAKAETPDWKDFDITTVATLKNADEKDVIAVHQNCSTVFVDGSNNAATNSNRWSLFVKKADGSILDHFVASTDKIVAGMPSLGYNALVLWNNAAIDEGELDTNYVGNTFAGIVHLNKQYSDGDDAKFKVTCFEYIGDKLNTNITNIKSSVSKLEKAIETEINDRIDADAELTTKIEERFESLSDELEKHIEESCNTGISNIDISGDDFITPEKTNTGWSLTLNNSTDISSSNTDGDKKVPTVNAVKNYINNLIDNNETNDIIWNLNDLLVSCINDTDRDGVKWVQELLRFNANNNANLISIINYESIYNTSNLIEATEKWITEALTENTSLSTDLAFRQDSFMTNQLFRLFFYNLDHKFSKTYGSDDSISRKFMKSGLTFKYLAKVEDNHVLNYPNEGFGKPRYKYITLRYRAKTKDGSDKEKEIDWEHIPTIQNTVNSDSTADTFQMAKAWDIIDSEEYDNSAIIKANIEALDERIAIIEGTTDFNTLETQPSETTQWIAVEFKEAGSINNIINKKIRGISIKVANTVSSPQYLAVFDTRTAGTKKLLGVSKGTTWNANETAVFKFNSPIIIPGTFEIFLLDNPISTDLTGDPTKPSYHIESYSLSGNQSYRHPDGGGWNNPKRSFYLTFNFVGDRMTTVEKNIEEHLEDNERHITDGERTKWNGILNDMLYDISYLHSNTNDVAKVENRILTTTSNETVEIPMRKITHAKYAFRTKINTTSPLTEFNFRIIDGGKPGSGYDRAYYYERDVRNDSYDEDVDGGNLETLGNLINGDGMFIRTGITVFNDDLSCLIRARQMFTNSSLTTFRSALPSLTFADRMFLGTKLTEFKIKLPNLSSAECMFRLCKNLEFVDTCLPNLTFAQGMFGYCTALNRIDLSPSSGANLYLADNMFTGCENLTSVKLNLEYLENAKDMFASGAHNGVTYNAPLLDLASVINMANTIKDWTNDYYTNRVHEIAIGINETSEIYNSGSSSYKQYIDQIADKNWKVSLYTSNSRQSPAFTIVKD